MVTRRSADAASPSKSTRSKTAAQQKPSPVKRRAAIVPDKPKPSPVKKKQIAAAKLPVKVRRVCRICEKQGLGTHYRDECPVMSKKGRAQALQDQARAAFEHPPAPPQSQPVFPPPGGPPQTWEQYSYVSPIQATPSRRDNANPAASVYLRQRAGGVASPFNTPSSRLAMNPFNTPSSRVAMNPRGPPVIDPALEEDEGLLSSPAHEPPSSPAPPPTSPQSPVEDREDVQEDDDDEADDNEPMTLFKDLQMPTATKPRRKIIPGEFGYVDNVSLNLASYPLARKHKKPTVAKSTDMGTRTFTRRIKTIIESCEDVSLQSGACIFFGAYYPTQKLDKIFTFTSDGLLHRSSKYATGVSLDFYNHMHSVGETNREATAKLVSTVAQRTQERDEANSRVAELTDHSTLLEAQLLEAQRKIAALQDKDS